MSVLRKCFAAMMFGLCFQVMLFAETIGLFYDNTVPQIQFAAGDLKKELEANQFTVEVSALSSLSAGYANKKVVIALASNATVVGLMGGSAPTGLGEQAYMIRSITQGQVSHWVLGGDNNGAMYGTMQIMENISMNGFAKDYSVQQSPFLMYRGMKLNLPMDRRLPTYQGQFKSRSSTRSLPHTWDINFWTELMDDVARRRVNLISVWTHHPFPALVKVPGWENACLPNIEGFNGYVRNDLNHDARVAHWKKVMEYGRDRGIKFYFFNWNAFVDYADTKYPSLSRSGTDAETKDYTSKTIQQMIATYPDLAGFGISLGDGMGGMSKEQKTDWSWDVYGSAVRAYLLANPTKKFGIIHRGLGTGIDLIAPAYATLKALPNVQCNFSVKYCQAHMYSTPTPRWYGDLSWEAKSGWRTFLTTRNEDFFYLNWGDPKFCRSFMAGIPNKQNIEGHYIGSDNTSPTRTYFYKGDFKNLNGQLEVSRLWYTQLLWGRIAFDTAVSDNVFKYALQKRYGFNGEEIFKAWSLASRSLTKITELVQGEWSLDMHWYPEACYSSPSSCTGFRAIDGSDGFDGAQTANSSKLCNIANSASNTCAAGTKSSYILADEFKRDADTALSLMQRMSSGGVQDKQVAINNVTQMAYLSQYYSYKIRGATLKKAGKSAEAKDAMGSAYCWWWKYSRSMDAMYEGDSMNRYEIYPDWKFNDDAVIKEYTALGGNISTLDCDKITYVGVQPILQKLQKPMTPSVTQVSVKGLSLNLPEDGDCSITLFSSNGKQVLFSKSFAGKKGFNRVKFDKKIGQGIYLVQVKAGNSSLVVKRAVTNR